MTASKDAAAPGESITFDGSASADPDPGESISSAWTFDDGGSATGATGSHAFTTAGSHSATLTVTDPVGRTGMAAKTVTIAAPAGPPPGEPFGLPGPGALGSGSPVVDADPPGTHVSLDATQRGTRVGATVKCDEACTIAGTIELAAKSHGGAVTVLGRGSAKLTKAGKVRLVVKLSAAGRARLRKAKHLRVILRVRTSDAAGNAVTIKRPFVLRP